MRIALQRELRVGARRSGTYWARIFAGALAAIALFQDASKNFAGRDMFFTALTIAFFACVFEGVRRGAGAIADEKSEGTLGLLFLTKLSGPQLMIGKYLAIGLSAFQTGFAAVPVLAAALLLGGISFGEFARSVIGLWHALLISICLSVLASARGIDPVRVMTRTWFLIGITSIFLFPLSIFLHQIRWANPMTPISGITDGNYGGTLWYYWISLALYQSLALGSLYWAGRRLFKNWQKSEEARFRESMFAAADKESPRGSKYVPLRERSRIFDSVG